MSRLLAAALAVLLAGGPAAADDIVRGPSPQVLAENAEAGPELLRIRIVNRAGGAVEVSRDGGTRWVAVGSVTAPAGGVNPAGFTASAWAADSAVCASAVNAIHVKVSNHPGTGRGVIFSIIPAGDTVGAAEGRPGTSIVTDIAGGAGIFGGGFTPPVGSPVSVVREGASRSLPPDYVPADGDVLVVRVLQTPTEVTAIEFENRFGGLIRLRYGDGSEKAIGQVLRPVVGIGRFAGTIDAAAGRLRANHPGVIDVSTSPLGMVGGFQIIPREHAGSAELSYVLTGTQWMVVGPLSALEPSWEGVAPLFARYLAPSYRPDDISGRHEDWVQRVLSRLQVQVRIGEGEWRLMPRIAIDPDAPEGADSHDCGRTGLWRIAGSLHPYSPLPAAAATALSGVTHIRIMLPRMQFWPAEH
ncbi:MAG: hypothetical protein AB7Y46_02420 [Armatimonadota bacterium]